VVIILISDELLPFFAIYVTQKLFLLSSLNNCGARNVSTLHDLSMYKHTHVHRTILQYSYKIFALWSDTKDSYWTELINQHYCCRCASSILRTKRKETICYSAIVSSQNWDYLLDTVVATNSGAQQDPAFWLLQPHPIQSETVVTALGCAFQENKYLYTGSYWFIKKIQQATKQRQEIVHVTRTPLLITRQRRFIDDDSSLSRALYWQRLILVKDALLTTTLYSHQRFIDDDALLPPTLYWQQHFIDDNSLLSTTLYWRRFILNFNK
jgi:hypothetical protein